MKRQPRPRARDEVPGGSHPWQSLRPAEVARARKLARKAGYPPRKVLAAVAKLLARHLTQQP